MNHHIPRLLLALSVALLTSGTLFPRASSAPPPPVVARVHVRDAAHLNVVAGELDIWEVHLADRYAVAAVTPGQRRWLEDLGYRVELDTSKSAVLQAGSPLDPRYHYVDRHHTNPRGRYVVDLLQRLNTRYPHLTELVDVGDGWMAGQPDEPHRDVWVMRVTNEDPAHGSVDEKPALFLAAAMHAREMVTTELALRYLRYLTEGYDGRGGYGIDPDVTWLVDHHVAYVLVVQNPDGHVENERDIGNYRRKNMDWDDGCAYPAQWGVDLNRNHSFFWGCCGGSSANPCAETYRGPAPASEPETRAFEAYFAQVMEDHNGPNGLHEIPPAAPLTTTGIFISLHSYGDLILWPWSFDGYGAAPNAPQLRAIGRKLAVHSGYAPSGAIGYEADGTVDDWSYGVFGIPSFTFEVGPGSGPCRGFFPPYDCLDGYAGRDFWAENLPAFLYAHRIAGAPYRTAYGPEVGAVNFAWAGDAAPGRGEVTVSLADLRCCGDPPRAIAGAELFIDHSGEDGTGIPMQPTDGDWGDTEEEAVLHLDTSSIAPGSHLLLVHARSEDGVWGPFSAAFLPVVPTLYLPLVTTP